MIFSKYQTVDNTCKEYVHPWNDSCIYASLGLFKPCIKESFRIYIIAYSVSLLLKGRIPTKKDLKNTILGIIQSCIFLTSHGVGYSAANCIIRRTIGHFNFYTLSFLPSFLSSVIAILIERPSRRALLSLYVTNVASETIFRMAVSRNFIKPIPLGEVIIFAVSISQLLYFYKSRAMPDDPIFSLLRFLVGPYEKKGYVKQHENYFSPNPLMTNKEKISNKYLKLLMEWYKQKLLQLKSLTLHPSCPHYHSCLYYVLSGGFQNFLRGYIIQLVMKMVLNIKRIIKRPGFIFTIPTKVDTLSLGLCLGSFTSLFRGVCCSLRRTCDCDSKYIALPAGFVAGLAFYFYRDNTIALYVMWKTFQICYNLGSSQGYVPDLKWAPVFFHAFSTAILFHVAIVEPSNLRRSYWHFLQAMSGGRIGKMDRRVVDLFGIESYKSLLKVLDGKSIK